MRSQVRRLLLRLLTSGLCLLGPAKADWAQAPVPHNGRLDSLETQLLRVVRADTNRVNTLNELVWENRDNHPRRALALATEALDLGQRLHFRRGLAKTYILRGIINSATAHFDAAVADYEQCRQQRAALGDWEGVANAIANVGEAQVSQGRYELAATNLVRALRLRQRHSRGPARTESIAADLATLGTVYEKMGQYPLALNYQQRYLRLPNRVADAHNEAQACGLIGELFDKLAQPDSALWYFRRAISVSHEHADLHGEAQAQLGLGRVLEVRHQYGDATTALTRALALAERVDDSATQAAGLNALGQLALDRQQTALARDYFTRAYQLSRQCNTREVTRTALAGLTAAARAQADYRAATSYGEQLAALKDSLLTEASTHQIAELHIRYETENQQANNRLQAAQLRIQQQVIRRRNVQLGASITIALLLAGLAFLLYGRYRLRQRLQREQAQQLSQQQRAAAVLEAEEAERRRIGADLHDGVGQLLTATRLNLAALSRDLDMTATQHLLLDNALSMVDESFREVRSISHDLMPNALIKHGLAAAVRGLLGKLSSSNGGLRAEVQLFGLEERLPPLVESVLFRAIQELTQNIIKHAQASTMTLQIVCGADELTVMVEDNGVGFDPATLRPDAGIGLHNVETRLAYLGGQAYIDAALGRGTVVTLTVPLTPAQPAS